VTSDLESLSFTLVNSATVVFALSMIAFAYDFAFSARLVREGDRADAAVPVAAGASSAGADSPVSGSRSGSSRASVSVVNEVRTKAAGIAVSLMVLATGLLAAGKIVRAVGAERAPFGNMYEFSTSAALAVAIVYLVLLPKYQLRWLGLFVVVPILLTLGVAVTLLYRPGTESLVPALNSYWLTIHVSAAIVSAGLFTVAAATTLLYLTVDSADRRGAAGRPPRGYGDDAAPGPTTPPAAPAARRGPPAPDTGWYGYVAARVPSAERLDRLSFRVTAFVFPLWTFAVVSGAIWAEDAWGRYWGWDPKETWAFITWVVYACYLHARVTAGWKGRRAAALGLLGFVTFLINYFGVNIFLDGLHSYGGL
jgi:cytochrome c-type biogenesis protein CcsB